MKLYELQRGVHFLLKEPPQMPPDSNSLDANDIFKFIKIDGMYGWCKDSNKTDLYFAAWTEVIPVHVYDEEES